MLAFPGMTMLYSGGTKNSALIPASLQMVDLGFEAFGLEEVATAASLGRGVADLDREATALPRRRDLTDCDSASEEIVTTGDLFL